MLVNLATYPWRNLPDVTLDREGPVRIITLGGRREYRYETAARAGPHLLLRRIR